MEAVESRRTIISSNNRICTQLGLARLMAIGHCTVQDAKIIGSRHGSAQDSFGNKRPAAVRQMWRVAVGVKRSLQPSFLIPFVFFAVLLCLGLSVYKDYGSFWDEGSERYSGLVNLNAVTSAIFPKITQKLREEKGVTIAPLSAYGDRYYGVALQLPLAAWEVLIGHKMEKRTVLQTRHLLLFLFVYVSSICLFLLLKRALGHWIFGLLGTALFWLSPRFFAEAFYNVKDIGFLAAFLIGTLFLFRYFESPTLGRIILLSLLSAFAAAVRLLGVVLPFVAIGYEVLMIARHRIKPIGLILNILAIAVSFGIFIILFYPASWNNPLSFFLNAAAYVSHHPWNGNLLFMGKILNAHHLPWYYLPVWIFITTPFPVLLLSSIGLIVGAIRFLEKNNDNLGPMGKSLWLVSTALFVGPLCLAFALKPTLYDGWRHFYFLYPSVIALATIGAAECWGLLSLVWRPFLWRRAGLSTIVFVLMFSPICFWMIKNHPFQYVYFSYIARPRAFINYEKDYWGVSEIKGLEYVMKTDRRNTIRILNSGETVQISEMLPDMDRHRIEWVEKPEDADYRLLNFRESLTDEPPGNEVFLIKVDGHRILSVIKNGDL